MAKSSYDNIAKPARKRSSATGTLVGVRLQNDELKAIDNWARKQEPLVTRPYAIRRLVELGLTVKTPAKSAAGKPGQRLRARELAENAIDKMGDRSAHPDERAHRGRRLTKGPEEFREARVDRSKSKPKG
jgi:hypothetical protein